MHFDGVQSRSSPSVTTCAGVNLGAWLPGNCRGAVLDNDVAFRTGGAKVCSIRTLPVPTRVMIFVVPAHQLTDVEQWYSYVSRARQGFHLCIQAALEGVRVDCTEVAACVETHMLRNGAAHSRGILVLSVPHSSIGKAVPDGGILLLWDEAHPFDRQDDSGIDDGLVIFLLPPQHIQ